MRDVVKRWRPYAVQSLYGDFARTGGPGPATRGEAAHPRAPRSAGGASEIARAFGGRVKRRADSRLRARGLRQDDPARGSPLLRRQWATGCVDIARSDR